MTSAFRRSLRLLSVSSATDNPRLPRTDQDGSLSLLTLTARRGSAKHRTAAAMRGSRRLTGGQRTGAEISVRLRPRCLAEYSASSAAARSDCSSRALCAGRDPNRCHDRDLMPFECDRPLREHPSQFVSCCYGIPTARLYLIAATLATGSPVPRPSSCVRPASGSRPCSAVPTSRFGDGKAAFRAYQRALLTLPLTSGRQRTARADLPQ
jgi:hypothetical protein